MFPSFFSLQCLKPLCGFSRQETSRVCHYFLHSNPGISYWSPIQISTRPNPAYLSRSYETVLARPSEQDPLNQGTVPLRWCWEYSPLKLHSPEPRPPLWLLFVLKLHAQGAHRRFPVLFGPSAHWYGRIDSQTLSTCWNPQSLTSS